MPSFFVDAVVKYNRSGLICADPCGSKDRVETKKTPNFKLHGKKEPGSL